MNYLQEVAISCPYCGESITVVVDESIEQQRYFEDCEVCCRPIDLRVSCSPSGEVRVDARNENDA
jgi:hypothetical protein